MLTNSTLLDDNVEDYIAEMRSRRVKKRMVVRYRNVLYSILEHSKKESIRSLSEADVIDFKWHIATKSTLVMVNFYLQVIRGFFRKMERKGICENVAKGVENILKEEIIPKVRAVLDGNIAEYLDDLKLRKCKESTVAIYRRALNHLLEFCKRECGKESLLTCRKEDVTRFKTHLAARFAPETTNLYLTATRGFFRYTEKKGICENVAIDVQDVPEVKTIPKVLVPPLAKQSILDANIAEYLEYLKSSELKESTIEAYRKDLNYLLEFCKKECGRESIFTCSRGDVISFKWHLAAKLAATTVNRYLKVIRGLFRYLERKGICEDVTKSVENVWEGKVILSFVGDSDLTRLFELADNSPDIFVKKSPCSTVLNPRDLALFEILIGTGITAPELCEIKRSDIDMNEGYIIVSKENKTFRILPLPRQTFGAVKEYAKYRERIFLHSPYFFVTRSGEQLSIRRARRICSEFLLQTDSKKKGPRTLRNTYINTLSQHGANIQDIKYLSGHSSVQITKKYTDLL